MSQTNDFYNFANHGITIDARYIGNKARFINHGNDKESNLTSEIKISDGKYVIGFYATKEIKKGEELLFNYDGSGQLKKHQNKYPFIKN